MDHSALATSVLKVNVGCCDACMKKLKKLLSNFEGVNTFDIDEEAGLVTVKGKADPAMLVKKISKSLRKARTELLSHEEPPAKPPTKEKEKPGSDDQKIDHHEGEIHHHREVEHWDFHSAQHHNNEYHLPIMQMQNSHNHYIPPLPNPHYPPPNPSSHHHSREHLLEDGMHQPLLQQHVEPIVYDRPVAQYNYDNGYHLSRQPPPAMPPPPYGYYGARHVPTTQDVTHFFSDENATGCTIM